MGLSLGGCASKRIGLLALAQTIASCYSQQRKAIKATYGYCFNHESPFFSLLQFAIVCLARLLIFIILSQRMNDSTKARGVVMTAQMQASFSHLVILPFKPALHFNKI